MVSKVSKTKTSAPKKTAAKQKTQKTAETKPKSADIKSNQPSARAKDIANNGEIKDGKFKSRSDATVGDIAQANAMKEDGTVDSKEVQSQVQEIVNSNPQLLKAAEEAGINLDNPTEEDLQKLANLDVKAGQEVDCPVKADEAEKPEEAGGAGGAGGGESPEESGKEKPPGCEGSQGAGGPQATDDKKDKDDPVAQIITLIDQAEQSKEPNVKKQLAQLAIQLIGELRSKAGVEKGQGQQQQTTTKGKNSQLVNTIQNGGKLDSEAVNSVLKGGDKVQIAQVLDSLETRATKAMNGNSNTMNAMNLQSVNALNKLGLTNEVLTIPGIIGV